MQRFWCGVVSRDHGKRGEEGGYCQIGTGKKAPLARMAVGDGIVIYSPVTEFAGKEKCQSFTAIGTVVGAAPYAVEIAPDFMPFRRDVRYRACHIAAIRPLIDQLVITAGFPNWGFKFRLGHFEIGAADFALIAHAMEAGPEMATPPGQPSSPATPAADAPSDAPAATQAAAPVGATMTAPRRARKTAPA